MISCSSLFGCREMVSFVPLKIRSGSVLITGIDIILNVINISYGEPEFTHHQKRSSLSNNAVVGALR